MFIYYILKVIYPDLAAGYSNNHWIPQIPEFSLCHRCGHNCALLFGCSTFLQKEHILGIDCKLGTRGSSLFSRRHLVEYF